MVAPKVLSTADVKCNKVGADEYLETNADTYKANLEESLSEISEKKNHEDD